MSVWNLPLVSETFIPCTAVNRMKESMTAVRRRSFIVFLLYSAEVPGSHFSSCLGHTLPCCRGLAEGRNFNGVEQKVLSDCFAKEDAPLWSVSSIGMEESKVFSIYIAFLTYTEIP